MVSVQNIIKQPEDLRHVPPSFSEEGVNILFLLMYLQGKTAELSTEKQILVEQQKKAAAFMRSVSEQIKGKGQFSSSTIDAIKTLIQNIKGTFPVGNLSFEEAKTLRSLDSMMVGLEKVKVELIKVEANIANEKKKVANLQREYDSHAREVADYTRKYKNGGFAVLGYNVYLAAKIIEYKTKRDKAAGALSDTNSKIQVLQGELNAQFANGIQKLRSTLGNIDTDGHRLHLESETDLEILRNTIAAAMSSVDRTQS